MSEQTFPSQLIADPTTRAGRMFTAGDVRVTVTDTKGGDHITIRFKAILDNRPPQVGTRPRPDEGRNWIRVPLKEATHVFIEVPRAGGDFPDKVATFYPRTGRFFPDSGADPERVGAAILAARWLNEGAQSTYRVGQYGLSEESNCGVCGLPLTDPESIARGIGPKCFGAETDSHHQVKGDSHVPTEERAIVEEILEALADLSDEAQDKVRNELNMWASQGRSQ